MGHAAIAAPRMTVPPRVSPAMEDYLRAVYRLQDGVPVSTGALAAELGVTGPSATNMVKRLASLGYLHHVSHRGAELTAAGVHVALHVTRHHRLLELYLVRSLGYGWDEAHAEADRLEHHISETLEAKLDAVLGHPATDPHGDPIPREDGSLEAACDVPLLDLAPGESATLRRVSDRNPDQLRYLG